MSISSKTQHQALISRAVTSAIAWRDSDSLDLQEGINACQSDGYGVLKSLMSDSGTYYDNCRRYLNNSREDAQAGIPLHVVDEHQMARVLKSKLASLHPLCNKV